MVAPLPIIRALPDRCAGALVAPTLPAQVLRHLAGRRPRLPQLPGVAISQGAFGEVDRLASFPNLIPYVNGAKNQKVGPESQESLSREAYRTCDASMV